MLQGYYRHADGTLTTVADTEGIHRALADTQGLLWLDLEAPSPEEAGVLSDVFDFHHLTIEDCLAPRFDPPKIDDYGRYLFVVAHGVEEYVRGRELEPAELDLYLGANYVVSSHLAPMAAVTTAMAMSPALSPSRVMSQATSSARTAMPTAMPIARRTANGLTPVSTQIFRTKTAANTAG